MITTILQHYDKLSPFYPNVTLLIASSNLKCNQNIDNSNNINDCIYSITSTFGKRNYRLVDVYLT